MVDQKNGGSPDKTRQDKTRHKTTRHKTQGITRQDKASKTSSPRHASGLRAES
jgi:hypothetical protein